MIHVFSLSQFRISPTGQRGVNTSSRKTMRAQSINFAFYIKNSFKFCIQFYKQQLFQHKKMNAWNYRRPGESIMYSQNNTIFPLSTIAPGMDKFTFLTDNWHILIQREKEVVWLPISLLLYSNWMRHFYYWLKNIWLTQFISS